MIIPRDTNDGYDYRYTYNPWGSWGRWVLLAIVIIIILSICASFFVRRKQPNLPPQQDIPMAPVYPQDPTMTNPPPPKYQQAGSAYRGPVWHGPQQQAYGEKEFEANHASYYPPPGGPSSSTDSHLNGNTYSPPPGPPPAAATGYSNQYGPPPGPPPANLMNVENRM